MKVKLQHLLLLLYIRSSISFHGNDNADLNQHGFTSSVHSFVLEAQDVAVIGVGEQCGGEGYGCQAFQCLDAPFPRARCAHASTCARLSHLLYECTSDKLSSTSNSRHTNDFHLQNPGRALRRSCTQVGPATMTGPAVRSQ